MREVEENEDLTFQIRLGKTLNAKLRSTDFITQRKLLGEAAGSKVHCRRAKWNLNERREMEMLLPQQGMEGQPTCSGMAASGPGGKKNDTQGQGMRKQSRDLQTTISDVRRHWKKWRIQAGKLCRKKVRLYKNKKKSKINKMLRAN